MTDKLEIHFSLAGFRMIILGRQFPDLNDFWDGNWLVVSCECHATGSSIQAAGPFVHLSGIVELLDKLENLQSMNCSSANVNFIEPNLGMEFEVDSLGQMKFCVRLTSDYERQDHRVTYELDQSYLATAISQCKNILLNYPIKDSGKSYF